MTCRTCRGNMLQFEITAKSVLNALGGDNAMPTGGLRPRCVVRGQRVGMVVFRSPLFFLRFVKPGDF